MSKQRKLPQLFPKTDVYPQFFQQNLVDENRVIKLLRGTYASQRVFYYQFLKLLHQIENDDDQQNSINYEQNFKQIVRKFIKQKQQQEKKQLQKHWAMLEYFIEYLKQNQQTSFQEYVECHRQIDQAFINILNGIAKQVQGCYGSKQKFSVWCHIFKLPIEQYEDCVRFQKSDIFAYIQTHQQIYMAFLNYCDGNDDQNQKQEMISLKNSIQDKKTANRNQSKHQKNDTIMNIIGDQMLHSSKYEGNQVVSNSFTQNNSNQFIVSPKKQIQNNQIYPIHEQTQFKTTNNQFMMQQPNQQSKTQSYQFDKYQQKNSGKPSKISELSHQSPTKPKQVQKQEQPDIFYRPKQIGKSHISKNNQNSKIRKKDPLDFSDSQEKGTFYRQFTNTKILSILPEPHRTKVKLMKNRFIGVHSHKTKY